MDYFYRRLKHYIFVYIRKWWQRLSTAQGIEYDLEIGLVKIKDYKKTYYIPVEIETDDTSWKFLYEDKIYSMPPRVKPNLALNDHVRFIPDSI